MMSVRAPSAGMSRVKKMKPGRRTLTTYSWPAMVRMLPGLARRMFGVPLHDRKEDLVQRGGGALKAVQRQAALHDLFEQVARLKTGGQGHPLAAVEVGDLQDARPALQGLRRADLDGVGGKALLDLVPPAIEHHPAAVVEGDALAQHPHQAPLVSGEHHRFSLGA